MDEIRLIDANALIRKIEDGVWIQIEDNYGQAIGREMLNPDFASVINKMPTIEAEPVKHGKWSECWRDPVRSVISVICSSCGDASITYLPKRDMTIDDVPKKICIQMPRCPKCGAKMK